MFSMIEVPLSVSIFVVEYTYLPGRPAKVSGRPEDCYPAEPEEVVVDGFVTYAEDEDGRRLRLPHVVAGILIDCFKQSINQAIRQDHKEALEDAEIL